MTLLPDKDHPVWKTVQVGLVLLGLVVVAVHSWIGAHHGTGVDSSDAGGVLSVGLLVKLLVQQFSVKGD